MKPGKENVEEAVLERKNRIESLEFQLKKMCAALEKERIEHRRLREEICLDEIQSVLYKHKCKLISLPDGRFQVTWDVSDAGILDNGD